MIITWLTDIHLNFKNKSDRISFYEEVRDSKGDIIIITGDIAEAGTIASILCEMRKIIKKKIYFVLGNHDYYGATIQETQDWVGWVACRYHNLSWLTELPPIRIDKGVWLVGKDGWADGRYGDFINSHVRLNDSVHIVDLYHAYVDGNSELLFKMQELAEIDAKGMDENLELVSKKRGVRKVVIATHVPPYEQCCLYNNKQTDSNFLPYFGSKIMGDVIFKHANANPHITYLVLAGHTHHAANVDITSNLSVMVGHAEYYHPAITEVAIE